AQMGTIHGKNLELFAFDPANPASSVDGLAIGWCHVWISKSGQARLAFGKLIDPTERHPREVSTGAPASHRGKKKSHDRHGQRGGHKPVKKNAQLHEQTAAGNCVFVWHRQTPIAGSDSQQNTVAPDSSRGAKPARQPHQSLPVPTS